MNNEVMHFLFTIANEIKRSFGCPVILLTMNDFAGDIINSMVDMRATLLQNAKPERLMQVINTFNIGWLQSVQDIENFKKRAKNTPREVILKSVDYTIECMKKRHKCFTKIFNLVNKTMTDTEKATIHSHLKILIDLQEIVDFSLVEKQISLRNTADKADYIKYVSNEIEELLTWLDRLYDYLAIHFCKVLKLTPLLLPTVLTNPLQQIINELASNSTPEAQKMAEELCLKGRTVGSMAHVIISINDLKINSVVKKIKQLEDRISELKSKKSSSGLIALQHKAIFLEDRLESLENLKISLSFLETQQTIPQKGDDTCKTINDDDIRIFNHLLPHHERCRLVEKLVNLWQIAIGGTKDKSMISIMSAADMKEVFSDDLGHFTIDKYGRKIYKIDDDDAVYQLNENNELVSVQDDENHVYFYDECGRYYLADNKKRVYKAHSNASSYMLHRSGMMLKFNEIENGTEYRYDDLGRYYVNANDNKIYREKGSSDEYRPDGLGNLVKIRDHEQYYLKECPIEPMVTKESKYLKETIGTALKKSLAEIVLVQPTDPIKYLADSLEKYWSSMESRKKRLQEEQEMQLERDRLIAEGKVSKSPCSSFGTEEFSLEDWNFRSYKSPMV